MNHSAPPTEARYGPVKSHGLAPEGGGYVVSCTCRWIRWWPKKSEASQGRLKHQKACKKSGGPE